MKRTTESRTFLVSFGAVLRKVAAAGAALPLPMGVARCPGVIDVMGGIGEDSGGLVITAAVSLSHAAAAWAGSDGSARVYLADGAKGDAAATFVVPMEEVRGLSAEDLSKRCEAGGASWAGVCLGMVRAAQEGGVGGDLSGGISILVSSDFSEKADLGREEVQATAVLEALFRLGGGAMNTLEKSRLIVRAASAINGLERQRTAMTALHAPASGAMLQLRFHPQPLCQPLELPTGIVIAGVRLSLQRPTSKKRLIETRTCAEMGNRLIRQFQQSDGAPPSRIEGRLAQLTPNDFVDRYRDRLPQKMTGQAFMTRLGTVRGLDGWIDPKLVYKVRSRAEHHIYENKRVHEFAMLIAKARRNNSVEDLRQAGELMYASHWSHSQRCGIGGVESDKLTTAIRQRGPAAGLFGAKVTGGGAGGEIAVLMRDDERSWAALAEAVTGVEAASRQSIETYNGSLPGAEHVGTEELLAAS